MSSASSVVEFSRFLLMTKIIKNLDSQAAAYTLMNTKWNKMVSVHGVLYYG